MLFDDDEDDVAVLDKPAVKATAKNMAKTIQELINTDGLEYAKYVLQSRAIPSFVDGFKPVQRKIAYVVAKNAKTTPRKIAAIAADLAGEAHYVHGEASASAASSLMGASWANNISLIRGVGNFGSRLVPVPAAPRYIFGKLDPIFNEVFVDENLAPPSNDEDNPEPKFYLPIIPWVLVNGSKGIAVGFACEIQPRNPLDLANRCLDVLANKKIKTAIPPWMWNFRGEIEPIDGGYGCIGVLEEGKRNKFIVTELPIDASRESYIEFLNKMEEEGKIIGFEDQCSAEGFRFEIAMNPAQRAKAEKVGYYKYLKLTKNLPENINVIDQDGKLRNYQTAEELLADFVQFRLGFYQKRIDTKIDALLKEHFDTKDLVKFITMIGDQTLKIAFKGKLRPKADIVAEANQLGIQYADRHVRLGIDSLTDDKLKELTEKINKIEVEIHFYKSTTPQALYEADLRGLSKAVSSYQKQQRDDSSGSRTSAKRA